MLLTFISMLFKSLFSRSMYDCFGQRTFHVFFYRYFELLDCNSVGVALLHSLCV